ncbi:MAG TPA: hypothetical protein VK326_07600 [Solirubrobacterales bacterium]|nr:hypothetical protein [Solirubrobacterales bacterium]
MPDPASTAAPTVADAAVAVAGLEALSDELRGCAILGPGGEALAATGDLATWDGAARGLLEAADRAAGEPIAHAHVGTEEGEVFAVRQGQFAIVAAVERFALAGLMLFDMRAVLRDLIREAAAPAPKPRARAA